MQVTSLFDLRQQLAVYLLPLLGECEILYSMPTVRRPLAAGVTTLVLNDHSVKRSEDTLPGSTPLLLEVGLRLTALHRDSMEAVEALTDAITALTLRGDFPSRTRQSCSVMGMETPCSLASSHAVRAAMQPSTVMPIREMASSGGTP